MVNSLVLGTGEVSTLDMATAFSTFANRGVRNDPVLIAKIEQVDEDGDVRVIKQHRPSAERVLSQDEADLVTHCLRQVVSGGTGRSAAFGSPAAGKTGTTQDNKDAWFVGYVPKLTAAVWMGYPSVDSDGDLPVMDDVHGIEVTGGSFPAQIWRAFMREATSGMDTGSFVPPDRFPGRVLNTELRDTTTTEASPSTEETTTTVDPEATTTTDEADGGSTSSSSSSSTSTSTTTAPTSTTPTTEDDGALN